MSLADELLNNLTDEEIAAYTTEDAEQNHIVIGADRFVTVPSELKRIAVQHDENVEVVTFDCPRYWKNLDMSKMKIYINYMLPSGKLGCYFANNVVIDELDTNIMHFDWNITSNATPEKGTLSFLVCIKKKDAGGKTKNHWNSELNREMYVSAGLECEEAIIAQYPDIITQILEQIDGEVIIANNPAVDKSLTIEGFAADSKATGRAISVERARIDALQAIPEGSTSADAALYDINIGYDGTDWKAPGAAVRGQASQLANYIDNKISQLSDENAELKSDIEDEIYFANVGSNVLPVVAKNRILYNAYNLIQDTKLQKGKYVNTDGSVLKSDATYITPYIDISVYNKLYATNCGLSAFYDDKLKYIVSFTPDYTGTDVPDNAKFARCTIFAEAFGKAGLFGNNIFPTLKSQIYLEDVIPPTFIVDKTAGITIGNRYKNLVDCIVDTYNIDCKIIVKSGTYDLYDEFATKYGESFTSGSTIFEGLKIQKQKVFCESGVTVKFEYSGDFLNITDYFSPIKFDGAGGEWHGGHIIAKNCRYAIHDDVFDTSDYSRTVIDGVVVDLNTSRNIAIGGGLGQSSDVTVTNCIFRQLDNTHGDCRAVYYHNAQTGANAVSNIKITGNYCNYGSIFIHSFGASTKKSTAIVSNNRCSAVTLFKQDGVIDNIELYQFNNKIETD